MEGRILGFATVVVVMDVLMSVNACYNISPDVEGAVRARTGIQGPSRVRGVVNADYGRFFTELDGLTLKGRVGKDYSCSGDYDDELLTNRDLYDIVTGRANKCLE